MAALKPGTHCIIIAGCPENIGLIVEVVEHLGRYRDREDAYCVRTVSGRPFKQLWLGKRLMPGDSNECITDRHKLRPLVDTDQEDLDSDIGVSPQLTEYPPLPTDDLIFHDIAETEGLPPKVSPLKSLKPDVPESGETPCG
jgi:hypothetical protein